MSEERRGTPRLDIPGALAGEVSVLVPIAVREISLSGILVESAYPLIIDSAHEIRLHLGDRAVVVKGRVVHCRIADLGHELVRYTAGLEFMDLPPHVASAIDAYVAGLRQARASTPGVAPPGSA